MVLIKSLKIWFAKRIDSWLSKKAIEHEPRLASSHFITDSERNMESREEEEIRLVHQDWHNYH